MLNDVVHLFEYYCTLVKQWRTSVKRYVDGHNNDRI